MAVWVERQVREYLESGLGICVCGWGVVIFGGSIGICDMSDLLSDFTHLVGMSSV
jgi:hypothetical protein